jgi:hypothetical protein
LLTINQTGNVGVGTTTPSAKFEVSGGDIKVGTNNQYLIGNVQIKSGAGTPNGADGAPVGSLYLNTNGGAYTTLYVKTATNSWTAK